MFNSRLALSTYVVLTPPDTLHTLDLCSPNTDINLSPLKKLHSATLILFF